MCIMDENVLTTMPTPMTDHKIRVLLVDVSMAVIDFLVPLHAGGEIEDIVTFDFPESFHVPAPEALVSSALDWISTASQDAPDRLQYYSAEEVPVTPPPTAPKRTPRRRNPGGGVGGGEGQPGTQKPRPTVASLAKSLEEITLALPGITSQLEELSQRTSAMEGNAARPPDRASALKRPLGSSASTGLSKPLTAAQLVTAMPPPKSTAVPLRQPRVSFDKTDVEELSSEYPQASPDMATAIYEQSRALTSLVAHLANSGSDPLMDLGLSTAALSSRGSMGRAKLQAELAAHRGTFFLSVMQSMARRMQPAMPVDADLAAMRNRGITPTQYLERFGGFGRTKDLGFIIWQVGLCMNHMQEGNHNAAMDALSLLFVCLEQASLDNGNMQVGLLLSLQEDPPASLFSGRSLALAAHPKPFAPTANQRWVTIALQYLKEMDLISSRRTEIAGGKSGDTSGGGGAASSSQGSQAQTKAKSKAKGRGRGRNSQQAQPAIEEEQ